uniref:Uncharacterized protein n=1 Tax=viral metagenome TaxID=1070528 RepID=A0A6C0CG91_9ZZZZ
MDYEREPDEREIRGFQLVEAIGLNSRLRDDYEYERFSDDDEHHLSHSDETVTTREFLEIRSKPCCDAVCVSKGPCKNIAKKFVSDYKLCKSHYSSYKRTGPKVFEQRQLISKYKFQRKTMVENGASEIDIHVFKYRHQLEMKQLFEKQSTIPDSDLDKSYIEEQQLKTRKLVLTRRSKTLFTELNIVAGHLARGVHYGVINDNRIQEFTVRIQYYENGCTEIGIIPNGNIRQMFDWICTLYNRLIGRVEQPRRELQEFVDDNQNVHREVVVDMVVQTYRTIIDHINVPDKYKWKKDYNYTVGEIFTECKFESKICDFIFHKYVEASTIYDIEAAYPKTLDAVWQFIKNHDDKDNLIRILGTETADSIGMCQQGCLTRLFNVLNGYLEGIEVRSLNEQLGDLIPPLREEPDVNRRIERARGVLRSLRVPDSQWDDWINSLIDEEDEDDRISREREMARMMSQ